LFITAQAIALFVLVTGQFRGIPLPSLILGGVTMIVYTVTQHTSLGRHLYAIGGNTEAAFVSGVPMKRTVIAAYSGMGAIVAITGFMQTAYAGSSTTTVGDLMELDAVAACVIGGVSLRLPPQWHDAHVRAAGAQIHRPRCRLDSRRVDGHAAEPESVTRIKPPRPCRLCGWP
jgi:ABC-type branched-subunit amino acid transport system permease subunit